MPISQAELQHLCHLAHLRVDGDHIEDMRQQVSSVIDHVAKLQEVDTDGVEPTAFAVPVESVLRDDEVNPSWSPEAVLANAPRRAHDLFEVQAIFD